MTVIPLSLLRRAGACDAQYDIVAKEWPDGVPVTPESAQRAVDLRLNLAWFAENVLTEGEYAEYQRQYALIDAEYERQRAPIYAEYERQHAPIRAEYQRQYALIYAEYERQRASIIGAILLQR